MFLSNIGRRSCCHNAIRSDNEVITVKDGKTVTRERDSACSQLPELCSLPACGKYPPGKLKQDDVAAEADIRPLKVQDWHL